MCSIFFVARDQSKKQAYQPESTNRSYGIISSNWKTAAFPFPRGDNLMIISFCETPKSHSIMNRLLFSFPITARSTSTDFCSNIIPAEEFDTVMKL